MPTPTPASRACGVCRGKRSPELPPGGPCRGFGAGTGVLSCLNRERLTLTSANDIFFWLLNAQLSACIHEPDMRAYHRHKWLICHITDFGIYPTHISQICIQCGAFLCLITLVKRIARFLFTGVVLRQPLSHVIKRAFYKLVIRSRSPCRFRSGHVSFPDGQLLKTLSHTTYFPTCASHMCFRCIVLCRLPPRALYSSEHPRPDATGRGRGGFSCTSRPAA